MTARGATLASDGDTSTGSAHIVELPNPAAARAFAVAEPGYHAGVHRDVVVAGRPTNLDEGDNVAIGDVNVVVVDNVPVFRESLCLPPWWFQPTPSTTNSAASRQQSPT